MPPRCTACAQRLELGQDLLSAQHAVLGPRGLVPLEPPLPFCSEKCVSQHFTPAQPGPQRIP